MEMHELIKKNDTELRELLQKTEAELHGMRFQVANSQLKNVRTIRNARSLVAQINTILSQRAIAAQKS